MELRITIIIFSVSFLIVLIEPIKWFIVILRKRFVSDEKFAKSIALKIRRAEYLDCRPDAWEYIFGIMCPKCLNIMIKWDDALDEKYTTCCNCNFKYKKR